MKIVVLGAGLVGLPMALDLQKEKSFSVTVCDINKEKLQDIHKNHGLKTVPVNLENSDEVKKVILNADIVLSAVPGFMGYKTLKSIIEAKKNVVDIAFFPEDMFELDDLARKNGVVAIADMGVAPGMSNILCEYANQVLDETDSIRIYVGGLPKARYWPFEYKAVFSPIDVIEEYTRPARFVRDGKIYVMPALTDSELMDFPGVGTLEAFNSDGLRSLMKTIDCPYMIEKTLRYPGHIEKMRFLRECGFFNNQPVEIDGIKVRPIDVTARLLFPLWEMGEQEDITVMKIIVEGKKGGHMTRYTYDLFDEFDKATGIHSMARTTGYAATAAVRMIAAGLYDRKGISPPEYIGRRPECVSFILKLLETRGIKYQETIEGVKH
jgi:lysine 6-dehydrogenase